MIKLFLWDAYYPCGGMNDLRGDFDFDSVDDAIKFVKEYELNNSMHGEYHIVDSSFKVINEGSWQGKL